MAQYINKDALVAEIKRRKELVSDPILSGNDLMIGERNALFNLLPFIDTLEVKEVDLEKEIKFSMNNLCELGCYAQSLLDNPEAYEGFAKPFPKEVDDELANFARHFYELGLKAQKGE